MNKRTLAIDYVKIRGQNSLKIVKRYMLEAWQRSSGLLSADNHVERMGSNQKKRHLNYIVGRTTEYLDRLGKIEKKKSRTKKDLSPVRSFIRSHNKEHRIGHNSKEIDAFGFFFNELCLSPDLY